MTIKLEDYESVSDEELRKSIASSYEITEEELDKYDILLAYQSVGSWGCDSMAHLIMRRKEDDALMYNQGSHCSCYGFEDQFEPEETSKEELQRYSFYAGGYDNNEDSNQKAMKDFIETL